MPKYCFTENTTPSEGTKVSEVWWNRSIESDDDTNHDDPLRLRASGPVRRAAMKAPNILTTLTPGMTVTAGSKLRFYKEAAVDATFSVHRILRNWTETGVRWSEYASGNSWATAGAANSSDVSTTLTADVLTTGAATGYIEFTSAQLDADIQAMIDGGINNYGWILDTDYTFGSFPISQTWDTDGQRPELIVTVTAGGAPTVSTVSSNSANEGTSIVHTVTLSAAVSGSAAVYAITLAGGTATGGGTDYTSTLTNTEFSDGVTISGGNITVPIGVSTFTVTVPTTDDQTIESAETYSLTVGGVAGTGTINDNDAALGVMATQYTAHKGRYVSYGLQRGKT